MGVRIHTAVGYCDVVAASVPVEARDALWDLDVAPAPAEQPKCWEEFGDIGPEFGGLWAKFVLEDIRQDPTTVDIPPAVVDSLPSGRLLWIPGAALRRINDTVDYHLHMAGNEPLEGVTRPLLWGIEPWCGRRPITETGAQEVSARKGRRQGGLVTRDDAHWFTAVELSDEHFQPLIAPSVVLAVIAARDILGVSSRDYLSKLRPYAISWWA